MNVFFLEHVVFDVNI